MGMKKHLSDFGTLHECEGGDGLRSRVCPRDARADGEGAGKSQVR